jgi:alginate O-acetyltransferase complex protein AlgI
MTPGIRLALATLGGIWLMKAVALRTARWPTGMALAAFLLIWPGVMPNAFCKRGPSRGIDGERYLGAWARMCLGVASIILLAVYAPRIPGFLLGMAGVAAILLAVHVGAADVLPWILRACGFDVPLLFDRPWVSRSLAEFWGARWNLAFVEMNRRLFLRGVRRRLGPDGTRFALFALSGSLHEIAISIPANGGWGLPLGYFLLQGALVAIEKRFRIANRAWTWFWIVAPSPWLFHSAFRHALIVPFYGWLHALIARNSFEWYLSYALYAAAAGQLSILTASFQVPRRLGWKDDLAKLTRFNRKIFYLYGVYILLCIVAFSALTWRLHDDFLAGAPAARGLAFFIAVFWSIRVLADVFWYDHHDWPKGNLFVTGHALLTSLFCSLATVYWVVAITG